MNLDADVEVVICICKFCFSQIKFTYFWCFFIPKGGEYQLGHWSYFLPLSHLKTVSCFANLVCLCCFKNLML